MGIMVSSLFYAKCRIFIISRSIPLGVLVLRDARALKSGGPITLRLGIPIWCMSLKPF